MVYPEESKLVLDAAFAVHAALGPGLLEQPYHNALYYELQELGASVGYNVPFEVLYRGRVVGCVLSSTIPGFCRYSFPEITAGISRVLPSLSDA